ncbi:MAG TPA: hypothetical protein DD490_20430 [Acidobacteria bacterium]|nr:hypothetical protein [Acidobacteriota bacterium]
MHAARSFLPVLLLLLPALVQAQPAPSAAELLARSIAWHDPEGRWATGAWRLTLAETAPGEEPGAATVLEIDNGRGRFVWSTERDGARLRGELRGDECILTLNGSTEIAPAEREKHRLTCERLPKLRNYFTYLWGLPMKLRDPGTRLDPEVRETTFEGRAVRALKITYAEGVGSDTWYFYLDRETSALVGYRFFHDEAKGDGEFIPLEGETTGGGLRLPRQRSWFTNQDRKLLGTDTLVAIEPLER